VVIKLYIVDNSQQFTDKVEDILFNEDTGIKVIGNSLNAGLCEDDAITVRQADVILISAALPDKNGIHVMSYLKKHVNAKAKYFITVKKNTRNLVDSAFEAGADGFFDKPMDMEKFINELYEKTGSEVEGSYHEQDEDEDEEEIFEIDNEEEYEDDEYEEEEKKPSKDRKVMDMFSGTTNGKNIFQNTFSEDDKPSRVIVFTSPKATGKTTTLVNVATSIKRNSEYDPSIVIVDLNLLFPSVAFKYLQEDLKYPKKTIYDVIDDLDDLDEELLNEALIEHEETGIKILNTPFKAIRNTDKVTGQIIKKLILYLRESFDVVLIDTTGNIRDDCTTVPLTMSDANVILFESDLVNLMHIEKFLEMIKMIEKKMEKKIIDKSVFVLNRYIEGASLSLDAVRANLFDLDGIEINVPLYIPEEINMTKYSNKGQFVVDMAGETSEKMNRLAGMVYPFYADGEIYKEKTKSKNSIFGALKNKMKKK
jgi:DNA-binding NarL/FixJ family response regulator/cellulose biosynthesis protein BcsQ